MELLQLADQTYVPVSTTGLGGRKLILQASRPTHFFNDGDGSFEVIEEYPTASVDAQASFVQVVEPNPTVIVNYILGPNGSLIPVYDSIPIDNTVTILAGAEQSASERTVPPHILDHMYAKKPKAPGTETPPKPRKRRKKEPQPTAPAVNEILIPEIMSPNTTKVNIIRKGMVVSSTPNIFRPVIPPRPKILQNAKTFVTSPQRFVSNSGIDLSSVPSSLSRISVSSSPSAPSTATTPLHDTLRIDYNDSLNNSGISTTSSLDTQTPAIYFIPSKANSNDAHAIIGPAVPGGSSSDASFIVTANEEAQGDGKQTEQTCILLPSSAFSSATNSHNSLPKTDGHTTHVDGSTSGQVRTFQLNSDGTLTDVSAKQDTTVLAYTGTGQLQPDNHQNSDGGNEFSICSYSDDVTEPVVMENEGGEIPSGGSFQLGDKQIFFSYE